MGASLMIGSFLLLRRAEDRAEQLVVPVEIVARGDVVDDVIEFVQALNTRRNAVPCRNPSEGGDDLLSLFGKHEVSKKFSSVRMRCLRANTERLELGKDRVLGNPIDGAPLRLISSTLCRYVL